MSGTDEEIEALREAGLLQPVCRSLAGATLRRTGPVRAGRRETELLAMSWAGYPAPEDELGPRSRADAADEVGRLVSQAKQDGLPSITGRPVDSGSSTISGR